MRNVHVMHPHDHRRVLTASAARLPATSTRCAPHLRARPKRAYASRRAPRPGRATYHGTWPPPALPLRRPLEPHCPWLTTRACTYAAGAVSADCEAAGAKVTTCGTCAAMNDANTACATCPGTCQDAFDEI